MNICDQWGLKMEISEKNLNKITLVVLESSTRDSSRQPYSKFTSIH